MAEFHDLTGRPGPANWSLGAYPEGAADLPVAGVSWYEAMAYAEFAGKAVPTIYEWRRAAPVELNSDVVLMSNFSGKALAPVGAYRGMTEFGTYDMAGNVKEWTVNGTGTLRYAMGGAWDEAPMSSASPMRGNRSYGPSPLDSAASGVPSRLRTQVSLNWSSGFESADREACRRQDVPDLRGISSVSAPDSNPVSTKPTTPLLIGLAKSCPSVRLTRTTA